MDAGSLDSSHVGTFRRVLMICYAFPPTGGGGVQRAVKFVKYLPEHGWQPTVLTVANPSVPVQDHDLAGDLAPEIDVVRAKTWEPGYGVKKQLVQGSAGPQASLKRLVRRLGMHVLQPDPQILWNHSAFRVAKRTLRAGRYDAIFVTGPPFSSFLIGRKLKKRFGIPLVLDFRDEWLLLTSQLENYHWTGLANRWQQAMMRSVLRAADAVIATTKASATELGAHCRKAKSKAHVTCIYNGFDPDDVNRLGGKSSGSAKLRIVYTGTLWNLTDISPLVSALESLARAEPGKVKEVELVVAGRRTPEQDFVLDRLSDISVDVTRHDYLPHSQALQLAAGADVLLLLLGDQPGAERVVPAKLFEYLALGKQVLSIGPSGETADLVREYCSTETLEPARVDCITTWLNAHLSAERTVRSEIATAQNNESDIGCFSRSVLAGELAKILEQCVTGSCG